MDYNGFKWLWCKWPYRERYGEWLLQGISSNRRITVLKVDLADKTILYTKEGNYIPKNILDTYLSQGNLFLLTGNESYLQDKEVL